MRSLEELREFFQHDRYATVTTGIEILEAGDGYAKVGLAVHEGHMNAGNRVMGAVYYTMADFAFAVASNPDAGHAPITFTLSSQINFLIIVPEAVTLTGAGQYGLRIDPQTITGICCDETRERRPPQIFCCQRDL